MALRNAVDGDLIVGFVDELRPFLFSDVAIQSRLSDEVYAMVFEQAADALGHSDFERRTVMGSAPGGLTEVAEAVDADVLVVGSTSHGPIGRVLPGSVGERLLAGSPCSVVVAPRGYASAGHDALRTIGIGYDGEAEAKLALAAAAELAESIAATLRVVVVTPPIQVPGPGRISGTAPGDARAMRKHFKGVVAEVSTALSAELNVDPVLLDGDPATTLIDQSRHLDLMLLGSRGYGPIRRVLLGGVATQVVRAAACPVLVTPRSAERRLGRSLLVEAPQRAASPLSD